MQDITVEELKQKMDNGDNFVFIDVREPFEYEEFNLGAQLIPLGSFLGALNDLEENRDNEIIIHCRSGARSGNAVQTLRQLGYKNARNVLGGVLEWRRLFG